MPLPHGIPGGCSMSILFLYRNIYSSYPMVYYVMNIHRNISYPLGYIPIWMCFFYIVYIVIIVIWLGIQKNPLDPTGPLKRQVWGSTCPNHTPESYPESNPRIIPPKKSRLWLFVLGLFGVVLTSVFMDLTSKLTGVGQIRWSLATFAYLHDISIESSPRTRSLIIVPKLAGSGELAGWLGGWVRGWLAG